MTNLTTAEVTRTIDTYLEMFNETDLTRRAGYIQASWAADGSYVDPLLQATGREALSEMAAAVQARYPSHRFRRVSGVDLHHEFLRFAWELAAPDGSVVAAGIDVGRLDSSGQIKGIAGFFGPLPDMEPAS